MSKLIWVFAGRTCHFVRFVTMRLILWQWNVNVKEQYSGKHTIKFHISPTTSSRKETETLETQQPVPTAQVVERPPREREVAGSKPGRAIPKALKMVPVATLLGAQHYKASTCCSHSQLTLHTKKRKEKKKKKKKKNTNPQHLVHRNPSDVPLGG